MKRSFWLTAISIKLNEYVHVVNDDDSNMIYFDITQLIHDKCTSILADKKKDVCQYKYFSKAYL